MDSQSTTDQGTPMAQPPQSAVAQPMPGAAPVPASEPPLPQLTGAPTPTEAPAVPSAAPVSQPPAGAAAPAPATNAGSSSQPASALAAVPAEAADTDVIEPEWVNRAKQIVSETHDDPYKQVKQLNQLKAEYMQKRYNKTVKLPDA